MTVWWQVPPTAAAAGITGVALHWREFPSGWDPAHIISVPLPAPTAEGAEAATTAQHVFTGLNPTSTYEFKLAWVDGAGVSGPLSRPMAADTLEAGCVPKDGAAAAKPKSSCVVQ